MIMEKKRPKQARERRAARIGEVIRGNRKLISRANPISHKRKQIPTKIHLTIPSNIPFLKILLLTSLIFSETFFR